VIADTAYDADHFREAIEKIRAVVISPNNPSHIKKLPLDKATYKECHMVE
jgi:putative transposase